MDEEMQDRLIVLPTQITWSDQTLDKYPYLKLTIGDIFYSWNPEIYHALSLKSSECIATYFQLNKRKNNRRKGDRRHASK